MVFVRTANGSGDEMKKKIIVGAFSLLIAMTALLFIVSAIETYQYEMDPANGVDILEGFGAVLIAIVGGFAIVYELDLFYTVYYFFCKPKTIAKSILNILSNLTLVLIVFADSIAHFLYKHVSEIFGEEIIVLMALLLMYVILRVVCAVLPVRQSTHAR